MTRNRRPNTVNANRRVWVRGLATLSSTSATPFGRSVTESRRLILIMPLLLLSKRDQRQLPFRVLFRACIRDQISSHRPGFPGTDQRPQRGFQSASQDNQPDLVIWSHRRQEGSSE